MGGRRRRIIAWSDDMEPLALDEEEDFDEEDFEDEDWEEDTKKCIPAI